MGCSKSHCHLHQKKAVALPAHSAMTKVPTPLLQEKFSGNRDTAYPSPTPTNFKHRRVEGWRTVGRNHNRNRPRSGSTSPAPGCGSGTNRRRVTSSHWASRYNAKNGPVHTSASPLILGSGQSYGCGVPEVVAMRWMLMLLCDDLPRVESRVEKIAQQAFSAPSFQPFEAPCSSSEQRRLPLALLLQRPERPAENRVKSMTKEKQNETERATHPGNRFSGRRRLRKQSKGQARKHGSNESFPVPAPRCRQ